MKFSGHWLNEWLSAPVDIAAFADKLSVSGLEVEALVELPNLSNLKVVKVVERAPLADKNLIKLQVDDGQAQHQVICGDESIEINELVAYAPVGAQLPPLGAVISKSIAGVESNGVLVSLAEIGLAAESQAVLRLPEASVGSPLAKALNLPDQIVEVAITPNRGDATSVKGIAREAACLYGHALKAPFDLSAINFPLEGNAPLVTNAAPEACHAFYAVTLDDLNVSSATPAWMQARLSTAGVRCINPVVDCLNYVMLELGQPMHAYDASTLSGGLTVRYAQAGEKVALLDGQEATLDEQTLVIADNDHVQGIAGVMGAKSSEVSLTSHSIVLECAYFTPEAIAGVARRYNRHTESAFRFERGVDMLGQLNALKRAVQLIQQYCGGTLGPLTVIESPHRHQSHAGIPFEQSMMSKVLGIEIEPKTTETLLTSLGFEVTTLGVGKWVVVPPAWRHDVQLAVDLIEEIARIHGFDKIPPTMPMGQRQSVGRKDRIVSDERLSAMMVDAGFNEAITYSFVSHELNVQVTPNLPGYALSNPIAADMSEMRTSLWSGLLATLSFNEARHTESVRLFEIGRTFVQTDKALLQDKHLAGLMAGRCHPESLHHPSREPDFFDVKGVVEGLCETMKLPLSFVPKAHPACHPGQCAALMLGDKAVGWCGMLHPKLIAALKLKGQVGLFDINLSAVTLPQQSTFVPPSKFPAVRRDFALLVDDSVSANELLETAKAIVSDWQHQWIVFDVFQGKGIPEGKKSIAIGLILQPMQRTLLEEEVASLTESVCSAWHKTHQAELRS